LGEVKDVEGLARSVELDEVRGNDFNLSLSRCVSAAVEAEHRDIQAILDGLRGWKSSASRRIATCARSSLNSGYRGREHENEPTF
jgi:type I restriction-modification system DNA methylase subunit